MPGKRNYGDPCGVARALDIVGERWALLVVRELLLGPKRFTDLRAGLPHVASDVLAQRLRDLEAGRIVRRSTLPPPAASRVYELTDRGQALEPVVLALGRWGSVAELPPEHHALSADAAVIALKTLFAPSATAGRNATCELRLGDQAFSVAVIGDRLEVSRGAADEPDAVIETDTPTLASLLWHGRSIEDARRSEALRTSGDRRAIARFLRLFPLPGEGDRSPSPQRAPRRRGKT